MNLVTDMPRLNGLRAFTMLIGSEVFGTSNEKTDESVELENGGIEFAAVGDT